MSGHICSMCAQNRDVRFTSQSGHSSAPSPRPFGANRLHWAGYSITSSASCCRCKGTSRPSALAVLRLITSSNLMGA